VQDNGDCSILENPILTPFQNPIRSFPPKLTAFYK
jgi:hypothetical protein